MLLINCKIISSDATRLTFPKIALANNIFPSICCAQAVGVDQCARLASSDKLRGRAHQSLPEMTSQTASLSAADRPRDWGRCARRLSSVDSNSFALQCKADFYVDVDVVSRRTQWTRSLGGPPRRRRRRRRRRAVFNRIERRHKLIEID